MSIINGTQNITNINVDGKDLSQTLAALEARQNSLTSALSSDAGDYNAEIIDARADAFGNSHQNAGNNIRNNQLYLYNSLLQKFNTLQAQYDSLSEAYINLAAVVSDLSK